MSALRPRRILPSLAALAFLWAVAIAVTGGFVTNTAFARFSSRDWRRPMIVAIAVFLVYAIKYPREWSADLRALARLRPGVLAAICALTAFAVGIGWGTFIGAGPDASGYVSQADMWRRGALMMSAPEWAAQAPWTDAVWSSAPVGYRPRGASPTLVPVYAPGLPLMMALFQAAGGQTAVFYVVPLLGALAVWSTFLLGRHVAGPWAGAVAAVLLLSSPPFLWFLIQPMSDVAVTAWWAVALVFAWRRSDRSAAPAGAATSAAILVRPNLVPLAVLVGALVAMNARGNLRRVLLFGFSAAPGPLIIAALNWYWHGSPLRSGYGSFEELYSSSYIWPNLHRYLTWTSDVQTPLIVLGLAAPFLLRYTAAERLRLAVLVTGFPVAVLCLYVAYLVFDVWQYLRFLLPAYPAVLAGVGAVLIAIIDRFRRSEVAIAAVIVVTAVVAVRAWDFTRREGVSEYARHDQSYAGAVAYANRLPQNAVLVSLAYSGTLHFYTGRDVLRWEVIRQTDLDAALGYLRARGHPLYFIGDEIEVRDFKGRFAGTRTVEQFDEYFVTRACEFVVYALTVP